MTKTEIIEAAFKVWGREFYLNTSLSQVARELGVSKPALYRHFINKQGLLDAMTWYFLDDFADFLRPDYEKGENISTLIRRVAEYYVRNVNIFIFLMIKLQNRKLEKSNLVKELRMRGVDLEKLLESIKKDTAIQPLIIRLLNATLIYFTADFHKTEKSLINPPSEADIAHILDAIGEIIGTGLCYSNEEIAALDYEGLENRIAGMMSSAGDDPLLKAVAGAVAEAGPWGTSMEQVATTNPIAAIKATTPKILIMFFIRKTPFLCDALPLLQAGNHVD